MSMQKIGDMYLLNEIASIYFNGYQISISSPFYIEVFFILFITSKKIYPVKHCVPSKEPDLSLSEAFFGDPRFTDSLR